MNHENKPEPDVLDVVIDGFRRMDVPERPAGLDLTVARPMNRDPAAAAPRDTRSRPWRASRFVARRSLWRVAASVLIAGLLGWLVVSRGPSHAVADVIAAAEGHKLVRYSQKQVTVMKAGPAHGSEAGSTVYADVKRPRLRTDTRYMTDGGEVVFTAVQDGTRGVGLMTNPETKVAVVHPVPKGVTPYIDVMRELLQNKDTNAKPDQLQGRKAVRYRLEEGRNTTTLWVDAKTRLPVRMEYEMRDPTPEISLNRFTASDYEWDPKVDDPEQLFSTAPPTGYTVNDMTKEGGKPSTVPTPRAKAKAEAVGPGSDINSLRATERRVREAARLALPALVAVEQANGEGPGGSGVIVSADGLVLSQYHVSHMLENRTSGNADRSRRAGEQLTVILHDGRRRTATLLGADRTYDVSLLRIVEPGNYPHTPLADGEQVDVGDQVLKLGHPGGYRPSRGPVVRLGRVLCRTTDSVVADCLINGGDSGGPLHSLGGRLVGVVRVSALTADLRRQAGATAARYVAPFCAYTSASQVRELMPSMLKGEVSAADEARGRDVIHRLRDAPRLPVERWSQGADARAPYNEVVRGARSGVISIRDGERRVWLGTVVSADGWVVTKASSLPANPRCEFGDGRVVSAVVHKFDSGGDVALLKIQLDGLSPVPLSDDTTLSIGTFVAAPGRQEALLGIGVVSARGQHSPAAGQLRDGVIEDAVPATIEHDVPLVGSECGGPVLDLAGRMVAITIARAPHGCTAVPVDHVRRLLAEATAGPPAAE